MKKILVTGGAGYIGSHVCKALDRAGFEIVVLDNLSTGNRGAVQWGEFIKGDLVDRELLDSLFQQYRFLAVMHFAGSIKVPESVENPQKYYGNNTRNSFNLIECCKQHNVNNFIFSSTAAVYGELVDGYASEDLPLNPINPYGRSKLMTEWMLQDLSQSKNDFNYIALRYFNVSGGDPEGDIGQAFPEPFHLINIACEVAAGNREKAFIFGTDYPTEDGTCERDYIHVSDLADAHVKALEYVVEQKESMAVNCGYGHGFSVKAVLAEVKRATQVDFPVENAPRRAGDPAILVSKVDKIKKTLNWTPQYDDLSLIIKTAYEWEKSETYRSWKEDRA